MILSSFSQVLTGSTRPCLFPHPIRVGRLGFMHCPSPASAILEPALDLDLDLDLNIVRPDLI